MFVKLHKFMSDANARHNDATTTTMMMARVVSTIPSSVFTTRASSSSCLVRRLVTRRDEDDDDDVHRAIALAKASYRSVLRATLGLRDDDDGRGTESTTTTTKIAPLSARARGVLVDRVATLARDDARRLGNKANNATLTLTSSSSRLAALREFTSKCVIATAFFRRAHRDPGSEEAAHARVAVGYLDGARRRERRLSPDGGAGASKKSKLLGGIRGEAQRAWSGVLQNECAAFTGFTSSLIPSDSDFHSD